tara:strand:+ start:453 stop:3485 length:3033 start_codon:yes stop_codon:yes gene_type:complete
MLDSSFLKTVLFTLILYSCGSGDSTTLTSENFFVSQSKSINGLVVDGYIRNADVWIETTNDFSSIGETITSSNGQGAFSLTTNLSNFRVQSSGGIDLETNNSLEGLILINHKIDELASSINSQKFIISPLTTIDFFLSLSLRELTNPIITTTNNILGLDPNLNINYSDHVGSLNNGFMFNEAYERANQLTTIALSLTKLVNNFSFSEINSTEIFQMISDRLIVMYQSSQNEINIESSIFLDSLVDDINLKFSLSLENAIRIKVKDMYKAFIPLIQVKPNLAATHSLIDFATNTFFTDLLLVASNNDQNNIYSRYSLDLISYLSEVTGQTESNLAFSITANSDSISSFEDQSFNIDVLENDDFDDQSSFNVSFTQPANGVITKNNSNILVYQPNSNFNGNDTFSYTLQQGSLSSTAFVNISVQPLPDAPIISMLSNSITIEENQSNVIVIVANDPDGDSLSFNLSGPDAAYFGISSSGELSFINPPDYETKSNFLVTVSVSDGSLSDSIDLVINISDITNEVDLLIYYAPDMLSEYLTESKIETKMQYQVTSLNNALVRSKAELSFNLIKLLPYDIDISNQSASQIIDASLGRAKIKQDQILYGADYHVIISRWNSIKGSTLGIASLDDKIDETDWDFWAGYLSNWTADSTWQELNCVLCIPDKVFSHELGHNLGSGHWPGSGGQSYAFGHRVDGDSDNNYQGPNDWGTIMTYSDISPDYFSNPEVNCRAGEPCGVLNISDNTRWYDSFATRFSDILPATNLNNSNTGKKINVKDFFPKINGGSSIYSNGGVQRTFRITSLGTISISGNPYETFKWENSVFSNSKMAFHFYERSGTYYLKRSDYESGYYFSGVDEYTLYDENNLCIFMEANKTIGSYLSRTCKNAFTGNPPIYNDTYHFTNFVKEELLTVPYGTYSTKKFVFALWDNSLYPSITAPYLMHVVFWVNNEVGIVQYRDHLGRIWKLVSADTDGDGQDNKTDNDDDNDGVLDSIDAFKLDPDASIDSNSDGIPD